MGENYSLSHLILRKSSLWGRLCDDIFFKLIFNSKDRFYSRKLAQVGLVTVLDFELLARSLHTLQPPFL
jgi:hypothetical protein